jgi:hypothetical protein
MEMDDGENAHEVMEGVASAGTNLVARQATEEAGVDQNAPTGSWSMLKTIIFKRITSRLIKSEARFKAEKDAGSTS